MITPPPILPRGRVLVVDDEPELTRLFAALLGAAGFEVATAGGGREALVRLGAGRFDVVVSDIAMPDMSGVALLRAVRELDLDVPVVLMTGRPEVDSAIEAVSYGAVRYLRKPMSEATLREAVEHAVRLRRVAALKREALRVLGEDGHLVGDRAGLEATLAAALSSLRVVYQPLVRARDGVLVGHEALVRTGALALPNPGALLDAAERLGALPTLGRAIRDAVVETMDGESGLATFVNLHPHDLEDELLYDPASALSRRAGSVVLEITERASLDGLRDVRGRVQRLRELGFRIAIDDLGAGYAGLASFSALAPDVVKLDMALVRGVHADPVKRKLVGSMAGVCKDLGIVVVAEGVEVAEERDALTELGCDLLQGFFIGRPEERPAR